MIKKRPSFYFITLYVFVYFCCTWLVGCTHPILSNSKNKEIKTATVAKTYLTDIRQLTFNGINSLARWSTNSEWVTFQHKGPGLLPGNSDDTAVCMQIYKIRKNGDDIQRVSSGMGTTGDPSFLPKVDRILFSTTEATHPECTPTPNDVNLLNGFSIDLNPNFQIYAVKNDGTDSIPLEPGAPRAYNSEATACRDGSVLFTSNRSGNPELFLAKMDYFGLFNDIKQITYNRSYSGGGVFSPDCKTIAWHSMQSESGQRQEKHTRLLPRYSLSPRKMEIWLANSDGSHPRQLTNFGALSFAPAFSPDGNHLLFTSNMSSKKKNLRLYLINTDGTDVVQISKTADSDSRATFSPNGKYIIFSSNHASLQENPTQSDRLDIFRANWEGIGQDDANMRE